MSIDTVVGGPSTEERALIYARSGMSESAARRVEQMVCGSPSRRVGKGALLNVITLFHSKKNGMQRYVESHTCELVHAYELELDPCVVGYYTQIACERVERITPLGRKHVSNAHIDFLIFTQDRVCLTECKRLERIEAKVANGSRDWEKDEGTWTHEPYRRYAIKHELEFQLWMPPKYPGVYLQNLEATYAAIHSSPSETIERIAKRVLHIIEKQPRSLCELKQMIDGFHERVALWMIGKRMAFGPWISTPMQQGDRFILFADKEQASLADRVNQAQVSQLMGQAYLTDPIVLASKIDLENARRRLARVQSAERDEGHLPRRLKALIHRVSEAVAKGNDPLSACCTHYAQSGNRSSRLCPGQIEAIEYVITRFWNRGRAKKKFELYNSLKDRCKELGIETPGRTTFHRRLRRENLARHMLAAGGMRAFHATRASVDARMRSLPPLACGHTIHIDSSKFDNRIAPNIIKNMPAAIATFYVAVDGASGEIVAHSLIFGPARTDGIAILLRNYVRRTGRMPIIVHVDRGPENRSNFIRSFANECTSVRWSPTGGSQWNSIAETAIKRVNDNVAHRLLGSTEPDKAGRKVDGRFKSEKNAKTSLAIIQEEIKRYLYEDFPNTPCTDGLTPTEKRESLTASYGEMGSAYQFNDDFRIKTSISVNIKKNVSPRKGVRTEEGFFTSDELIDLLRRYSIEDLRSDCEDPTILWVHIGGDWIKVFHARVQTMALCSFEDKLFDLMYAPFRRSNVRKKKAEVEYSQHKRLQWANRLSEKSPCVANPETPGPALEPPIDPSLVTEKAKRKDAWDALEPLANRG